MALIVVAEDDPGTLKLLSLVLRKQGHDVIEAVHGTLAWEHIRRHQPDLVVSDVNMPGMTGFELLAYVRDDIDLAITPFILLTSLQERQNMRQGMRMGADDYLTKPFQSQELLEAVTAQLNKQALRQAAQDMQWHTRLSDALETQARHLVDDYEDRLALALNTQWPGGTDQRASPSQIEATVLCAGIRHLDRWAQALRPDELAHLLKRFHESCGDTIFLFGASHMQFTGDGVVAIYGDSDIAGTSASPGLRAIKAALGLRKVVAGLQAFVDRQWGHGHQAPSVRDLPALELAVALHGGPVGLLRLEGLVGGAVQTVPVGQTVVDTLAMLRHTESAGDTGVTPVIASVGVLRSITGTVQVAQRYLLNLPSREHPLDVCRIEPLPG